MMLRPADKCYPVLIELCSLVPVLSYEYDLNAKVMETRRTEYDNRN